ncbi:MAG TPA: HD domain-containing protein [Patescibacteria group bacterium]|nr:HD domain-containing protein [Patescibacteria group bacterium]
MDIEKVLQDIQSHPLFLRLKNVVENGYEGDKTWHDHEPVFDHSTKTLRIARERLSGDFITNPEAKRLFENWKEQEIFGVKQKDLTLLISLIHDCGKIVSYKEEEKVASIVTPKPGFSDQVICPGHEYWGAKLVVQELLKNTPFSEDSKKYIQTVVEYHGFFSNPYFSTKTNQSVEELLKGLKPYYGGYYIEGLFNMYCDGYTATAFEEGKKRIEELFNCPDLYISREYFIPEK